MVRLDPLAERRRATPDRIALVDARSGEHLTYAGLDRSVGKLAASLATEEPEGRICLLTTPSTEAVEAIHACLRLGATVAPVNPALDEARLARQITTTDPSLILTTEAVHRLPGDRFEVPVVRVEAARSIDEPPAQSPAEWSPHDTMVLLFTSGTTGEPKPVPLSSKNLLASAAGSACRLGVLPTDNWVCCLPIHHMGGLAPILRSTFYGTAVTVHESFDADTIARSIRTQSPTGISVVPTQLTRLLEAEAPLSDLRFVLLGGAPAPGPLIERSHREAVPVYPTYGLTETASQVTTATPSETVEFPGTVGRPLVGTTVTIVDGEGNALAEGEAGEIVVDGPTVFAGYPDDTGDGFGEFGFRTGDIGYLEDGRLWVTGRADDVILSGGELVHPATVRATITSHPDVDDAWVVGIEDTEWGERVAALVAADDLTREEVKAYVTPRLAPYEVPKTWAFAHELPRTTSGTVDRAAVQRQLREVNGPSAD